MKRITKIYSLLILVIIVLILCFFRWVGPYGEEYLPEWIEKGVYLVDAIESFRAENNRLPDRLPVEPELKSIPGCRNIMYRKFSREGEGEYYRIYMYIHLRECVIYDSRNKYDSGDNWGTFKVLNGWVYTCD